MKWIVPVLLVGLSLYSVNYCVGVRRGPDDVIFFAPAWLLVVNIVVCLVAGFLLARAVYRRHSAR